MKHAVALALFFVGSARAYACASCGSGGDDPLVLYPNEETKAYVGLSRATAFKNVGPGGEVVTAGGPATKDTTTVAVGRAISRRAFATVTLPYVRNARDGDSESGMGDPSVAARYTAVLPTLAEPALPQVQLVAGYKHAQAKSIHDTEDPRTLLDVFGTGFSEAKAGVDVWYGNYAAKAGVAVTALFPQERTFDGTRYQPGDGVRATASAGYGWTARAKTTVGANREQRRALRLDGEEQADSGQLVHSAFLTQDLMPGPLDDVKLTLSRQAAFGRNVNTARSTSVSLAYTRVF